MVILLKIYKNTLQMCVFYVISINFQQEKLVALLMKILPTKLKLNKKLNARLT